MVRQDNTKTGVSEPDRYDPELNALYAEFAEHWGFTPLPSTPSHPEEQGIQERAGAYVNSNALRGREFASLGEMNEYLAKWNRTIAQQRIHGTTRRQVINHFLEIEKPALLSPPGDRFDICEVGTRAVHPDGYVEVDGAYYTAPYQLVGRRLRVRWNERLVRIYDGDDLLRTHLKQVRRGEWVTDPHDRPEHKPARQEAYQANLLARAERVGKHAHAWAKEAVVERDVRAYRLLQGVLGLTRKHTRETVDAACATALEARLFRFKPVQQLVEKLGSKDVEKTPAMTQEHEIIRPLSEYAALAEQGDDDAA
ncbi:MAG: Mu transposase domain-containing protein [Acidimicrobiales bacterium]